MQVKPISAPPAGREFTEVELREIAKLYADVFKPQRLNFAGVCVYCTRRWCEDAACVAMHERSIWLPCQDCDGFGAVADCRSCMHGVAEVSPTVAAALGGRDLPAEAPAETYLVA